jgi:hypothetical protein
MHPWFTRRRLGPPAAIAATALVAGVGLAWVQPAAKQSAAASVPASKSGTATAGRPYGVTLLTGDTVRVTPLSDGRYATVTQPGPGRAGMPFTTTRTATGGVRVVPADALPLLAADRVDGRLFDVVLLHKLGHDRGDVPVLLGRVRRTAGGQAPAPVSRGASRGPGRSSRCADASYPAAARDALGTGRAVGRSRFWAATRAAGPRRSTRSGSTADGVCRWNRSVGQIGAPAAWKAGLTGKGVTVARAGLRVRPDASRPQGAR